MSRTGRRIVASTIHSVLLLISLIFFGTTVAVVVVGGFIAACIGSLLSHAVVALVNWLRWRRWIRQLKAEGRRLDAILAELEDSSDRSGLVHYGQGLTCTY